MKPERVGQLPDLTSPTVDMQRPADRNGSVTHSLVTRESTATNRELT
jgi:hypothetical protein